jgi:antirestriction protein ArdC
LLSRESLQGHGDERVYAYEEFVAEFTASILSQQFGLDTTVSHAEYLNIYIKAIEDEPRKILIDAFNEAKAAVKLMTDFVEKPVSTRIERQLLVS